MDQNQNGINGENPGDVYTGRFLFQPFTNHAPVLSATSAKLPFVPVNMLTAVADVGESVNNFVTNDLTPAPGITDPDNANYAPPQTGAFVGIAITGVDDSNGTWQYSSLDGGTTWVNMGSLSITAALLLEANNGAQCRQRQNPIFTKHQLRRPGHLHLQGLGRNQRAQSDNRRRRRHGRCER